MFLSKRHTLRGYFVLDRRVGHTAEHIRQLPTRPHSRMTPRFILFRTLTTSSGRILNYTHHVG